MNRLVPQTIVPDGSCPLVEDPQRVQSDYVGYLTDESRLSPGEAASLALPHSVEQLCYVLARHHERGHPVTISGGRTGVVGGAVAGPGAHMVSTERLVGFEGPFDEHGEGPWVRVKAGTTLEQLNEALADHAPNLFFPVDPTETSATLGGMVATNASGMRSLRYGSVREWVRGLRVVLADGSIIALRRGEVQAEQGELALAGPGGDRQLHIQEAIPKPSTKNALGYLAHPSVDAVDLFVGAEGTLGVVAEVELRLERRADLRLFYLQLFPDERVALDFVAWLRDSADLRPVAIETYDQRSLALLRRTVSATRCRLVSLIGQGSAAAVYAEFDLADEDELERADEAIRGFLQTHEIPTDHSAAGIDEATARQMRVFRHAVPEQINALVAVRKKTVPELHKVSTDMAVPPEHLRTIYAVYRDVLLEQGLEFFIFGHAGNAHFHVNIVPRSSEELQRAMELYEGFAREVIRLGGAVAGEHGIGRIKRRFLAMQYQADHLDAMKRIKRFFDPLGRLNAGVLLP